MELDCIDSGSLPSFLRMRTTAYIKSIMEVYGKTFTGLGLKEETCFVLFLGCYIFDLFYVFYTLFDFSKSYNYMMLKL